MRSTTVRAAVVSGLLGLATATPVSPSSKLLKIRQTGSTEPCALAAAAYTAALPAAAQLEQNPQIPADVALKCVLSVPIDPEYALNTTASLKPLIDIQSTTDYLIDPPEGYLYDAVNLQKELLGIESRIRNNEYTSEWQFEVDLKALMAMGKDGHLGFNAELVTLFTWVRPGLHLVAISSDGKTIPQIYNFDHVLVRGEQGVSTKSLDAASPVIEINGLTVNDFINAEAYAFTMQDPDANWNLMTWSAQSQVSAFSRPAFYPGPTTTLKYANGTVETYDNFAVVGDDISAITSGEDLYLQAIAKHSLLANSSEPTIERRDNTGMTQLPNYPAPEMIDIGGVLSGYFLEGAGYEDIAVLAVSSFLPFPMGSPTEIQNANSDSFQDTVQAFLAHAYENHKTKLIIDVQGNGGGSVDLSLDLYMQLFPNSTGPNSKNNIRASDGMKLLFDAAGALVAEADANPDSLIGARAELQLTPFAYQSIMTPEVENFNSSEEYYGPVKLGEGYYSSFSQFNWTNNDRDELFAAGTTITGTNNRTGFPQYFAAEDIVYLTDGKCGSACTILAELLKNEQGVRQITLGGRPQTGAMQAIGGVKGSQLFPAPVVDLLLYVWANNVTAAAKNHLGNSDWENFNALPGQRAPSLALNGRNAYRLGDVNQTCLHFAYEAADCRMFFDFEMTASLSAIWQKTAQAVFTKGAIDNSMCVDGSTGQPTAVTGGLKYGEMGPQTPPKGAAATLGWLVNGTDIIQGSGVGMFTGKQQARSGVGSEADASSGVDGEGENGAGNGPSSTENPDDNGLSAEQKKALSSLETACASYKGDAWLVSLLCGAL